MTILSNARVLLVEDDPFVAMAIEEVLSDAGCIIVGPAGDIEEAIRAAREEAIDVAVLDISLDGSPAYPVAEALKSRRLPFLFLTGSDRRDFPAEYSDQPTLKKPASMQDLIDALVRLMSERACTTRQNLSSRARIGAS